MFDFIRYPTLLQYKVCVAGQRSGACVAMYVRSIVSPPAPGDATFHTKRERYVRSAYSPISTTTTTAGLLPSHASDRKSIPTLFSGSGNPYVAQVTGTHPPTHPPSLHGVDVDVFLVETSNNVHRHSTPTRCLLNNVANPKRC